MNVLMTKTADLTLPALDLARGQFRGWVLCGPSGLWAQHYDYNKECINHSLGDCCSLWFRFDQILI